MLELQRVADEYPNAYWYSDQAFNDEELYGEEACFDALAKFKDIQRINNEIDGLNRCRKKLKKILKEKFDFGYDNDSIKAKKVFMAVCEEYNNLKMLYSDKELEEMQKIE